MKAAQLVAPARIELAELPEPPAPGPDEVLVRMSAVGICGSDMHWYNEGRIGDHPAVYPMILGHEPAGVVVEAGAAGHSAGHGLRSGDRVTIEPTVSCGHCEYCLVGQHNNCPQSYFMGSPEVQGLLREYAVAPAKNVMRVPDTLTDAQAALIEPTAVIMHMLQLAPFRVGWTAAIVGAGPIGMLSAAVLKQSGASAVYATDCRPYRVEMARQMGADQAVPVGQFQQCVMDGTGGRGAHFVIDAAGGADAVNLAMAVAAPGATVVVIAIPTELINPISLPLALSKELHIIALKRSNHNTEAAIGILASGRIPAALVTHRFPLEKAPEAFRAVAAYAGGVGKVLIEFGG